MALYICEVSVTVIVDADGEQEACELAIDGAEEELGNSPDCMPRKITDPDQVPTEWLDAIPYGSDLSDATVAQRMAELFK